MKYLLPMFAVTQRLLVAAQRCPMEIWVYRSALQCLTSFRNPSAIGVLYADNKCHSSKILFAVDDSAELLLPGTYSSHCLEGGAQAIEFVHSGCSSSNCVVPSSGLCSDDLKKSATLYSLGSSPPVYDVHDLHSKNTSESLHCTTLTGAGGLELSFVVFGNCSDPSCNDEAFGSTQVTDVHLRTLSEPSTNSTATATAKAHDEQQTSPQTAATGATASTSEPDSNRSAIIISTVVIFILVLSTCLGLLVLHRRRLSAYQTDLKETITSEGKEPSGATVTTCSSPRVISVPNEMDDLSTLESPSEFCFQDDQQSAQHYNARHHSALDILDCDDSVYTSGNEPMDETRSVTSLYPDDETTPDIPDDDGSPTGRRFQVVAPPGDLGLVIDSTREGIPEVYSIRSSSKLIGQVRVGDQLHAIDGIDLTFASHTELLRLIDLRSDACRRLTFFRPLKIDEWGVLAP